MIVDVLAGTPGRGKSEWMLKEAADVPAKYLFALPTIKLIEEQASRFRHLKPSSRTKR